MRTELLWLLVLMIFSTRGRAQDTLTLKLQDALNATLNNNSELELATLDEEIAVAKFNQTNAAFLPQLNLSYSAMVTNNPLNVFGFKLQQQSVAASDFNPQLLNSPSAAQNYVTKVEWSQPLINMDMIYLRKAAGQQIDAYSFKTRRTKEYLVFEVQKAYAQLQLSHQAVVVLTEALYTISSIRTATENYYQKGLLQKSELLRVEVELATVKNKLAEANSNVRNASDYMSLLMGVKDKPLYKVDALVKTEVIENMETQVSESRADLKSLKSVLAAQDFMINSGKLSHLPKLNAFANYMFNDKAPFGFASNSYLVGAQFSWSLFNGTAIHHRITEQKIVRNRIERQLDYQKEQSQLELNKTLRQFFDSQFALKQHESSVQQATEALRILRNRFEQGLVSINDLLQSQSTLSEQEFRLSETIFKYNTTVAYLHFLTSISEK